MTNRIAGKNPLRGFLLILLITSTQIYMLNASADALHIEYNLIIPKKKIYIGEKINFELHFSYPASQYLRIRSIQDPEIPGISQLKITGPQVREVMHNNVRLRQFIWHGCCVPDAPGKLVIPALRAVYSVNFETHELYSKPEVIHVQKLHQEIAINAMGKFKRIEMTAERKQMVAGTAQKIFVRVEGSACSSVKAPHLVVPNELKYYESTIDVKKTAPELPVYKQNSGDTQDNIMYTFEYIVQAVNPGEFIIEPEEFIYFDPDMEKYSRLKSNKIKLSVTGVYTGPQNGMDASSAAASCDALHKLAEGDAGDQEISEKNISPEELIGQHIAGLQKNKQSYGLPWGLFFILLIVPSFLIAVKLVPIGYNYYWPKSYRQSKYAFWVARKNINRAAQQCNSTVVYGIVKAAIAQRCNMPDITDEIIELKLKQAGCTPELLARWQKFSVDLLMPEFGDKNMPLDEAQVFLTARDLISRFEKIL